MVYDRANLTTPDNSTADIGENIQATTSIQAPSAVVLVTEKPPVHIAPAAQIKVSGNYMKTNPLNHESAFKSQKNKNQKRQETHMYKSSTSTTAKLEFLEVIDDSVHDVTVSESYVADYYEALLYRSWSDIFYAHVSIETLFTNMSTEKCCVNHISQVQAAGMLYSRQNKYITLIHLSELYTPMTCLVNFFQHSGRESNN